MHFLFRQKTLIAIGTTIFLTIIITDYYITVASNTGYITIQSLGGDKRNGGDNGKDVGVAFPASEIKRDKASKSIVIRGSDSEDNNDEYGYEEEEEDANHRNSTEFLDEMIDYMRRDDQRLVRVGVPNKQASYRQSDACETDIDATLRHLTNPNSKVSVLTSAAQVISLCTNSNPYFRRYIATHDEEMEEQEQEGEGGGWRKVHDTLIAMIEMGINNDEGGGEEDGGKEEEWEWKKIERWEAVSSAAEAVFFLSHNGPVHHEGLVKGGIVPVLTNILQSSSRVIYVNDADAKEEEDGRRISRRKISSARSKATMWAAAAVENLAASYCSWGENGNCEWSWVDGKGLVLTMEEEQKDKQEEDGMTIDAVYVREEMMKDDVLVGALGHLACQGGDGSSVGNGWPSKAVLYEGYDGIAIESEGNFYYNYDGDEEREGNDDYSTEEASEADSEEKSGDDEERDEQTRRRLEEEREEGSGEVGDYEYYPNTEEEEEETMLHPPTIITWAAVGALRNLALPSGKEEKNGNRLLKLFPDDGKRLKECLCIVKSSPDWLESSRALDALLRLGVPTNRCQSSLPPPSGPSSYDSTRCQNLRMDGQSLSPQKSIDNHRHHHHNEKVIIPEWINDQNETCDMYEKYGLCHEFGHKAGRDGSVLTANDACCVCGGGKRNTGGDSGGGENLSLMAKTKSIRMRTS